MRLWPNVLIKLLVGQSKAHLVYFLCQFLASHRFSDHRNESRAAGLIISEFFISRIQTCARSQNSPELLLIGRAFWGSFTFNCDISLLFLSSASHFEFYFCKSVKFARNVFTKDRIVEIRFLSRHHIVVMNENAVPKAKKSSGLDWMMNDFHNRTIVCQKVNLDMCEPHDESELLTKI